MALAEQWQEIESGLAPGWGDARMRLLLADVAQEPRAAALLGPLNPWRTTGELRFYAVSRGSGPRPDALRRALERLDREGIGGTLELVASDAAPAAPELSRRTLAESWDAAAATLPPDWSDLYLELELDSSDYIAPASLEMTPLNARREGGRPALRFRAARVFGYGASPGMVRRCLERCDAAEITGELHVLRVLSGERPVQTQGPVWYVGGRTV
jgi:hypothetical protein